VYGRVVFFAVVLGVFTSLWRAVAEVSMPIAAEPRTLVWYLAMTEWVVLSVPTAHVDTLAGHLWELVVMFSCYPEPLFGGVLRLLLFTVLPAGFIGVRASPLRAGTVVDYGRDAAGRRDRVHNLGCHRVRARTAPLLIG
jgi:hypothetical protein